MSTSDKEINMKSRGDNGISIQNYGHINLTNNHDGEKELRSKRKRKPSERDTKPDIEGTRRGKRSKCEGINF